ncbi:uncharacterized protein LOC123564337 isoform X2 [Mercenaria mercenaria]|nr:uncharacterized protein LOC123564337 isoform X2 [Mercenaria mercenaria]XP_045213780.2 uncharacterized protein LOC123564337 isoform X2 [Mercenaria mercenaria]
MYHQSYRQQTNGHHSPSGYQHRHNYYYQQNQGNRYAEYQHEQVRQNRNFMPHNQRQRSYHSNKENNNDPHNLDYYMISKDGTDRRDSWSSDEQRHSRSPRRSRHDSRRREEYRRRSSSQRKHSNSPRDYTNTRSSRHYRSRSPRIHSSRSPSRGRKKEDRSRSKSSSSSRSTSVTSATSDGSVRRKISPENRKVKHRNRITERVSEHKSKRTVYRRNFFQSTSRSYFDRSRYTWKKPETKVEMTIGDLTMSPISSDDFSQRSEEAESEGDKEETGISIPNSNVKVEGENKTGNNMESKKTKEVKPVKEISDQIATNENTVATTECEAKNEHEKNALGDEMTNKSQEVKDVTQKDATKQEAKRNVKRKSSSGELKHATSERRPYRKDSCIDYTKEHSNLRKNTEEQIKTGCIIDEMNSVRKDEGSISANIMKDVKNNDICNKPIKMLKEEQPKCMPSNNKSAVRDSLLNAQVTDNDKNTTEDEKAEKVELKKKGTVEELKETLLQTKSIGNEMIDKIVSLVASKSKHNESDLNINKTPCKGRKERKTSEKSTESNKDENLAESKKGKHDKCSKDEVSGIKSKFDGKIKIPKGKKEVEKSALKNQNTKSAREGKQMNRESTKLFQERNTANMGKEVMKKTENKRQVSSNESTDHDTFIDDTFFDKNMKEQKQKEKSMSGSKSVEKSIDQNSKEVLKRESLKESNPGVSKLHDKRNHSQSKACSDEVKQNIPKHRHNEGQFTLQSVIEKTLDQAFSPELKKSPPPYTSQSSVQNKSYYFSGGLSAKEQQNEVPKFDLVNTRYGNKNNKKLDGSSSSQGRSSDKKGKESSRPAPTDLDQSRSHTLSINEKKKCFEARIKSKEKNKSEDMRQFDSNEQFAKNNSKNVDPFRDKEHKKLLVSLERFDKSSFPQKNSPTEPLSINQRERRLSGVVESSKSNTRKRHGSESSSPAVVKGTMNRPSGDVFIPLGKPSEKKRRLSQPNPSRNPAGHIVHVSPGSNTGDMPKIDKVETEPVKEKEINSFAETKNKFENIDTKDLTEKVPPEENTSSGPKRSLFGKNQKRISHFCNLDKNDVKSQVLKVPKINSSPQKSPASKRSPQKNPAPKRLKHLFKQSPVRKYSKVSPVVQKEVNTEKRTAASKDTGGVISHNSPNTETKLAEAQVTLSPVDNIFEKMKETTERTDEKRTYDDKSKTAVKRTHDDKLKNTNEKRRKHEENVTESTIKKHKNVVSSEGTEEYKNVKEEQQIRRDTLEKKSKNNKSELKECIERNSVKEDDKNILTTSNRHRSNSKKTNPESKTDDKLDKQQTLKDSASHVSKSEKPKHGQDMSCLEAHTRSETDNSVYDVKDKDHFEVTKKKIKKYSERSKPKLACLQTGIQADKEVSVDKKVSKVEKRTIHTEVTKLCGDNTQKVLAGVETQEEGFKKFDNVQEPQNLKDHISNVSEFDQAKSEEVKCPKGCIKSGTEDTTCINELTSVRKDRVKLEVFKNEVQKHVDKKKPILQNEKHANKEIRVGKKVSDNEKKTVGGKVKDFSSDATQKLLGDIDSVSENEKSYFVENVHVGKGINNDSILNNNKKNAKSCGIKSPMIYSSPEKLDSTEYEKKDVKEMKVEKHTAKVEKRKVDKITKFVGINCATSNKAEKMSDGAENDDQDTKEKVNQHTLKDDKTYSCAFAEKSENGNDIENEFDQTTHSETVNAKETDSHKIKGIGEEITHDGSESDMDDIEPIEMIGCCFMNDVDIEEPAEKSLISHVDVEHIETDLKINYCDDNVLFRNIDTEDVFEHDNEVDKRVCNGAANEDLLSEKDTKNNLERYDVSKCQMSDIVIASNCKNKVDIRRETGRECAELNENILESNKNTESTFKSPDKPKKSTPRKRFTTQLENLGKKMEVDIEGLKDSEGTKAKMPINQDKNEKKIETKCSCDNGGDDDDDDDAELISSGVELTPTKTIKKSATKTTEWLQRAKSTLKVPASLTKSKKELHHTSAQQFPLVNQTEISNAQVTQLNSVQQSQTQTTSTNFNQHQQKIQEVHETSAQYFQPINQKQTNTSPVAQLQNSMEHFLPQGVQTKNKQGRQSLINQGVHHTQQFQPRVPERPNRQSLWQGQLGIDYAMQAKSSEQSLAYQQSVNYNYVMNQLDCSSASVHQNPHLNTENVMQEVPFSSQNVANIPMFNPLTAPLMNQNTPASMNQGQVDARYQTKSLVNTSDYAGVPLSVTQSQGIPVVLADCVGTSWQSASTSNVITQNLNYTVALPPIEMPGVQEPVRPNQSTHSREPASRQKTSPPRAIFFKHLPDTAGQLMTEAAVEEKRKKLYRELCDLDNINSGDDGLDIMLLAEKSYLRGITLIDKDILSLTEKRCDTILQQGHQQLPTLKPDGKKHSIEERANYLGQLKRYQQ